MVFRQKRSKFLMAGTAKIELDKLALLIPSPRKHRHRYYYVPVYLGSIVSRSDGQFEHC